MKNSPLFYSKFNANLIKNCAARSFFVNTAQFDFQNRHFSDALKGLIMQFLMH